MCCSVCWQRDGLSTLQTPFGHCPAGFTFMVQRTAFLALSAASRHCSKVSRLASDSGAVATISAQLSGAAVCINLCPASHRLRSEEHTSELQSLMRISYAVFCLKKKNT